MSQKLNCNWSLCSFYYYAAESMKELTRISYYENILYLVGSVHRGSINITLTVPLKRSIYVNKQPGGKFQSVGPDTENNKFFEPSKLAEIFLLCFWVSSFLLSSWFKEKNKTSVSLHVIFSFIIIKGTVSLISSDPQCQEENATIFWNLWLFIE